MTRLSHIYSINESKN
ncbi:hypothetical protein CP8484711_1818A, partial [Chlamydia psittaci 84-8471/1]